ncbi:polyol/monosaccharide transporter 5, partial [Prunus dulcis]
YPTESDSKRQPTWPVLAPELLIIHRKNSKLQPSLNKYILLVLCWLPPTLFSWVMENISSRTEQNRGGFVFVLISEYGRLDFFADIGVMSGAALFIREDLNISTTQVEILVGSLNALHYSPGSSNISNRCTSNGTRTSFPFLIAGRVVAGIGVGYSLMIAPVYVAELSPALTRGFLSSLPEVFINGGILLGYISNYALSGMPQNINWRLMLGLAAFPAIAVALAVLAMPESPRWLVMKGRLDEAKQVLMRTSETKEEAELRLKEIAKAASSLLITSTPAAGTSLSSNWHGQGVWRELLLRPTRPIRRILIAAIGVNFFMQASGNDAVVYYSPEVFREAGIHNKKHLVGVTILMGIAKTSFVLVSALFLDRFGRRPLLLLGSIGMAISLACLGFGSKFLEFSGDKPDWAIGLCVVAVCSAASFFSIGLGPITWVYSSEIFPMRLRAQGSSLAIGVNRLVSGLVAMTFLSISREITFGGMFFALAGIMVVGTVFFYFFLPETKGKSLEEIGVLFEDQANSEKAGTGMNKYTIVCALLASTNSILLGYDIGVMSGAVLCIKENLKITSTQVEILVGTLNMFSLFGSLASGKTSDYIGRRYTIVLAACTFLIGALLMGLATSYLFLLAGRAVAGIGVGYALMIAPVYTAELSPAMSRGFLTSLPEVFITFGLLVGYIVNYALSGLPPNMNWRLMLGLAAVPAVGIGLGVIAMPESPRWLVMKGKLSEAKQVLIRTSASEEEAQLRLEEISKAALALPPSTSH